MNRRYREVFVTVIFYGLLFATNFAYSLSDNALNLHEKVPIKDKLEKSLDSQFNIILKVLDQFEEVNSKFNKIIEEEKTGQLIRSTDKLRHNLYQLEFDSRDLLRAIPENRPTPKELEHLKVSITKLHANIQDISDTLRIVGPDLRLYDADASPDFEEIIDTGVRHRGFTIQKIEDSLIHS